MSQPYFDTFKYVKLLTEHHFSYQQTQGLMSAQIHVLNSILDRLVTREDLVHSEYALRADLLETEHKLKADINRLEANIGSEVQRLDAKIDSVAQRLEGKIDSVEQRLEAKISTTASELKAFTIKNTLATLLANVSIIVGIAALMD